MSNRLYHERLYRGDRLMEQARDAPVTVCGAGALGANIVESLARQGFTTLKVIDRDRVQERNLSTQPYHVSDVGALKAKILANSVFRAVGVAVQGQTMELTPENAGRLLGGSALVLDVFDNSQSRRAVKEYCDGASLPCLHVGLAADYAEVIWNEAYRVPSVANDDVCDYPLARNLVMLAVAVACETVVEFLSKGARSSFTITLRDFSIRQYTT